MPLVLPPARHKIGRTVPAKLVDSPSNHHPAPPPPPVMKHVMPKLESASVKPEAIQSIKAQQPDWEKCGGWCRGVFLPPLARKLATPSRGILHYEGVDHLFTKAGKKTPLGWCPFVCFSWNIERTPTILGAPHFKTNPNRNT